MTMMEPGISIIVPLYNKAAFVREMLQPLIPQLLPQDEILIVDDCSTDGSRDAIRDLLSDNVRFCSTPVNSGPATARNQAASLSSKPFLLFFDADDLPHPQMLQRVRGAISTHSGQGLFAFTIASEVRGEKSRAVVRYDETSVPKCTVMARDAFAREALKGKTLCTASSTCVSRGAFESETGFMEGLRYCEDPELWARLSARYQTVFIEEVLSIYRHVPSSLSYGMRTIPGSVQPYVETLLRLAQRRGAVYQNLAKSLVRKNTIFSRAAGAKRSAVIAYLRSISFLFDNLELATLRAAVWLPSGTWRTMLEIRGRLIRLLRLLAAGATGEGVE